MIAAILSGLGLGSLALAMVFVPGVRLAVFSFLRFVAGLIRENPWQAACLALALWGAWERWDGVRGWDRAAEWKAHHDRHLAADKASIARAIALRKQVEEGAAIVTELIKEKVDAENRLNAALADSLRLRGPGRAAALCRTGSGAGLPGGPGGPRTDDRPGDDGVAGLPDDEAMATVPWADFVTRAELADRNRTEVTAWREWYARQKALIDGAKGR